MEKVNEATLIPERYFYHSFPRRVAKGEDEIEKGCKILEAVRDIGLVLTPELIEWKQPLLDGSERVLPILQKRVCFTELSPKELAHHSQRFGKFSLEFDVHTLRSLGAVPVFYLPQPISDVGADALGVGLLGIAMDAFALINRMASLDKILNGQHKVAEKLDFNSSFARSPEHAERYELDSAEARNFLQAISHGVTPWEQLSNGLGVLLNFFYPADDTVRDKLLDYYRQREWRIACGFAINGAALLRLLSETEKQKVLGIDNEFFSRVLKTDTEEIKMLDACLAHSGLATLPLIAMPRRVIVPEKALAQARHILSTLPSPPTVIALESLGAN